jgi:8-oxo-dGTP pyrophosphatase MutT (NUDIX family)
LREVREETGLQTELVEPLDKIEYWFYVQGKAHRVRVHKFVYFFLLRYMSGDTQDHDHEVNEARWVDIRQAEDMLAFESEKKVMAKARQILLGEEAS